MRSFISKSNTKNSLFLSKPKIFLRFAPSYSFTTFLLAHDSIQRGWSKEPIMPFRLFFALAILFLIGMSCGGTDQTTHDSSALSSAETTEATPTYISKTAQDNNGLSYTYVTNDPAKARIYTLDNGLTVFLSVDDDKPEIDTYIVVKAGSKFDPADSTGLAHYLEHMMFKGTDEIGTMDWDAEKVLIDQIADLYEAHKQATDPIEKKAIYQQIDTLSYEAAQYAIPNGYDQLASLLGATGTNAFTMDDMTVFVNTIPANELERWLLIETERFQDLVLRLFHTELEVVYSEFNRWHDRDEVRITDILSAQLFPHHPYGTQPTIGLAEHLKNPSMKQIHQYFDTYYVPNNMAICLVGDMNMDEAILQVKNHLEAWKEKEVPPLELQPADPITEIKEKTIYGPSAEFLRIGFQFHGTNTVDEKMVTLIDMIMSNAKAGLIDLNLNQTQKVLHAASYPYFFKDYGAYILHGMAREGQTLEEVRDLLLEQLEKVKRGEFDEWLMTAVINDMRLHQIEQMEHNRAWLLGSSFGFDVSWQDRLRFLDELEQVTKDELVAFAKQHFKDNYVVVYKRTGESQDKVRVEKPELTPLEVNREAHSEFFQSIAAMDTERMEPEFIDYDTAIKRSQIKETVPFHYIKNTTNDIFKLAIKLDMGKYHDIKLPLALEYLPYLGTQEYSPDAFQKELYKYGISLDVSSDSTHCIVFLKGLDRSLEDGIRLFEHLLRNVEPNTEAYQQMIQGILMDRMNQKKNKDQVLWAGMYTYAKYGDDAPFRDIVSAEELVALNPEELTQRIQSLLDYEHTIFYYGPRKMENVADLISTYHDVPSSFNPYPEMKEYTELDMQSTQVYFTHMDLVQAEIVLLSKDQQFDAGLLPQLKLFNAYFGNNMSSIVFQEIRESKALAYSAWAGFTMPPRPEEHHYVFGYIGTQWDKSQMAIDAMLDLFTNFKAVPQFFDLTKDSILRTYESARITKDSIYMSYLQLQEMGLDHDIREDIYKEVQTLSLEDVETFFEEHIVGKEYTILVLGNREFVDLEGLEAYGPVTELSLETLFNF
jgi:zinc protease